MNTIGIVLTVIVVIASAILNFPEKEDDKK